MQDLQDAKSHRMENLAPGTSFYNRLLHCLEETFLDWRPIVINKYTHYGLPKPVMNLLMKLVYTQKLSKWIESHPLSKLQATKVDLYDAICKSESLNDNIHYLEFGVASGCSFEWWVANIANHEARFTGFDTFTGLPEDWGIWVKGSINAGGRAPDIADDRCEFQAGLFQQTLQSFLQNQKLDNRRLIIHLDADLYTSTLFVLATLAPRLKCGDIVIFDELSSMRCPEQEFRAFIDFVSSFRMGYEVIGATTAYKQVAIKITPWNE